MRRSHRTVAALAILLLAGCTEATPYGKCVGLNGHERADRIYEYDAGNIVLGIAGAELIYPPVKVALDELKCPVGVRADTSKEAR